MTGARPCVLVLAGGAGWESAVLPALGDAGMVVLRRCVDIVDLVATASTRQAGIAVVDGGLPLDAETVDALGRHDVAVVALLPAGADATRLERLGVAACVPPDPATVVAAVGALARHEAEPRPAEPDEDRPPAGRTVAVWGPGGAPGRTTVAIGLAAVRAAGGARMTLVDADPYAGTVAQQLGVLDEVSGLLVVARLANAGALDPAGLGGAVRGVGERLEVLTGLPRPDRRAEVRPGVMPRVLRAAAVRGDVVVDTGFCLEEGSRDQMSVESVTAADEVVVVGGAEPVGLARLARALVELGELAPGIAPHVVVNRMRSSLGWSERDVTGMIGDYARPAGVHLLPDDRGTLDRAAVSGRSLAELGDSPLLAALTRLAGAVFE